MVSEDSQGLRRFPVVHRLSDLRNLDDARHRQVPMQFHQGDDPDELVEVLPLRSPKWVLLEERNDLRAEILESVNVEPEEILTVIVASPIPVDLAAAEESAEVLQRVTARLSLDDVERWSYLPLESHLVTRVDGAAETALSIHEAHDPSSGLEPFLLVFRTRRIVTLHVITVVRGNDTSGTARCTGFPAYSRLRTTPSPVRGAAPSACLRASYLRTVIVTAAVYRRLGSELRHPKVADPSP
jgi:hypothetical protein